jgi:hypothetical protein
MMNYTTINSTIKTLKTQAQFPKKSFAQPNFNDKSNDQFVYADFVVKLDDVLTSAKQNNAAGFEIIADTIVVSENAALEINGKIQIMTMIARSIVVENNGTSSIILDHTDNKSFRSVNIIASEISDGLKLISKSAATHIYDLSKIKPKPTSEPLMARFGYKNGVVREGKTAVPIGYLNWDQPLYKVFNASFALTAGLLRNDSIAENVTLGRDLMTWISKWAGLQSDIATIGKLATSMLKLIPSVKDAYSNNLTIDTPMPSLTAKSYLVLAQTRSELARQVESDSNLATQSITAQEMSAKFAEAFARRDLISARTIKEEINKVLEQSDQIEQSLRRASTMMEQLQFDQMIKKLDMDLAQKLDTIDKIAIAAIGIAISVVSLGASIASMAMGAPSDPGAATKKGQEGVQGLIAAVKEAGKTSDSMSSWVSVIRVYLVPITFMIKTGNDNIDNIKSIASAGVLIKDAINTIYAADHEVKKLNTIASNIGTTVQALAQQPSAAETLAAWNGTITESVNNLDNFINNSDAGSVKTAVTDYKTALQKVAIYGQLIIEQQSQKYEVQRHLGSLVLQHIAEIKKSKTFDSLKVGDLDMAELIKHIETASAHAMDDTRLSFFEACYGFRRAQYYETYEYPAATPAYCCGSATMSEIYSAMKTDFENTSRDTIEFNLPFKVTERNVLDELQTGLPVAITIPIEFDDFKSFSHLRLSYVEARIKTDVDVAGAIGINMDSQSFFEDRNQTSNVITISGNTFNVMFEYEEDKIRLSNKFTSVMPPPFCTWTVQITKPKNLPKLETLEINLVGKGVK